MNIFKKFKKNVLFYLINVVKNENIKKEIKLKWKQYQIYLNQDLICFYN